jgi:ATP-dependent DNA helicase DinG
MNPCIDFQVCNHNFLLADVIKRKQGGNPMLPNYQAVIIDEVHKFLPAARQMYGTGLSNTEPEALHGMLEKLPFVNEKKGRLACKYCQAALNFNDDLFKYLARSAAGFTQSGEIQDRAKTHIGKHAQIALRALSYNAGRLAGLLRENAADIKSADALYHSECIGLMHRFDALKKKADLFLSPEDMIYWLEAPFELNNKELRLASIPKDIDKRLYMDIWSKPFPKILTSGTIAVNGGFGYIKGQLGLNRVWKGGILETVKQAPFNYKEQCLLYISEKTPFPAPPEGIAGTASDNDLEKKYIDAVVKEINILITAACGHTAVLFTSYRVMGMVMSRFRNGRLPYPVFRLSKGEPFALEDFKASGNGVLFAAGTFWDGIDIPGDILSSLIIVKLPFAAPDPVNEYERSLCGSELEFKEQYVFADMIIRLKQGIGRLIRREDDTGLISILDFRMRLGAKYRSKVLAALPEYRVTSSVKDIHAFFRNKKSEEYFTRISEK